MIINIIILNLIVMLTVLPIDSILKKYGLSKFQIIVILLPISILFYIFTNPLLNLIYLIISIIIVLSISLIFNVDNKYLKVSTLSFFILSILFKLFNFEKISSYTSAIFLILFILIIIKEQLYDEE